MGMRQVALHAGSPAPTPELTSKSLVGELGDVRPERFYPASADGSAGQGMLAQDPAGSRKRTAQAEGGS
jgi:hypothetical protein